MFLSSLIISPIYCDGIFELFSILNFVIYTEQKLPCKCKFDNVTFYEA